ncbi:hypothetical protein VNO77_18758 [Canavalia gladiata]|uniref:BHLH domain-containing protein n=1 Tax=Canavalia gladiata TaxID=3824 RepID=A0AAN9LQ38_CANGL
MKFPLSELDSQTEAYALAVEKESFMLLVYWEVGARLCTWHLQCSSPCGMCDIQRGLEGKNVRCTWMTPQLEYMESFQGPLSSCLFGGHLEVNCLEQSLVDKERLKLEEDEQCMVSSLDDNNMPFLQMLPFNEPSFETLIRLKKPWERVAHIPIFEMRSPFKSESNDLQHQHSAFEVAKVGCQRNQAQDCGKDTIADSAAAVTRERRKRKRTKQTKNKEEVENQRMTHIAVERNRRRQMNDHLRVLKSLMPPSYIQRGDHASIIGGAIDFVKELEQLLQSLETQKRMKRNEDVRWGLFEHGYGMCSATEEVNCGDEVKAEKKSETIAIEVTMIQSHVNLKIRSQKRPGQLLKAIVALEGLSLTILHLNITSSQATVLYSFNLKIEEDSKIVSASEVAEAVDRIFSSIDDS